LSAHDGSLTALRSESGAQMSYAELRQQAERTAAALNASGIGPGSPVAMVLENGPHMASAFVAVAAAAAAAPLHPGLREREFKDSLESLQARALIVAAGSESAASRMAAQLAIPILELEPTDAAGGFRLIGGPANGRSRQDPPSPEDTALLLHTSGTTAKPKLVPLTQANLAASAANIASTLRLGPEDTCLNIMPLFHIHGLIGALLSSLSAGASVAATPGFAPMRFFKWLDELRPTWYSAVPTMHQAILQRSARNAASLAQNRLRLIRSSSAALPPSVLAALEAAFGCPVVESYGMTEAAHQMASNPLPPAERKAGTVGLAAGPEVAVMDGAGSLLPAGSTGEVVIRGANVMAGYVENPQANASAFHDGWFRTGDQGFRDSEGYFTITGRLKELINRGGEKISPREIDEALLEHPAVAQAVAFAVPHPKLGEEIGAAIVLEDGAELTQRALGEFAAERLAAYKVPRVVSFVEAIPKGPSGKLKRVGLAKDLGLG
jgi:acyl-CoA synthetase (AMP-forming)/AMP-acid ligase II